MVRGANVTPVLLPAIGSKYSDEVIDHLDGVLLTGSLSNLSPALYCSDSASSAELLDPKRDATVLQLIKVAVKTGVPVLAICRGLQELNVAYGGTLRTDLGKRKSGIAHGSTPGLGKEERYGKAHVVELRRGSLLNQITGQDRIEVNSLHEQGIDDLASELVVEGVAPDGVIEAVRVRDAEFAVGVQWHPEWRFWEEPSSLALFRAFGAAVHSYAGRRCHGSSVNQADSGKR
jgi:putative glutamine amidotransferase